MRDVKMFASRTDILAKSAIFGNTPVEKWLVWEFCTLELSEEPSSTIWDSFYGGESPTYDFFFSVTDGQSANSN